MGPTPAGRAPALPRRSQPDPRKPSLWAPTLAQRSLAVRCTSRSSDCKPPWGPLLQGVDRRAALGLLAAAAAVSTAQPSEAAYGDAARVFAGNITNKSGACGRGTLWRFRAPRNGTDRASPPRFPPRPPPIALRLPPAGFIPYAGEGFALLIPSKWNPSKEQDFPGVVLRCVPAQRPAGCAEQLLQAGRPPARSLAHSYAALESDAMLRHAAGRPAHFRRSCLLRVHPRSPLPGPLLPPVSLRSYEDNGDAVNNLVVLVQKVGKNNIDELGSPDKFLQDNAYLFGESAAFTGEIKEGSAYGLVGIGQSTAAMASAPVPRACKALHDWASQGGPHTQRMGTQAARACTASSPILHAAPRPAPTLFCMCLTNPAQPHPLPRPQARPCLRAASCPTRWPPPACWTCRRRPTRRARSTTR